ncbi:hypothetical protein ACFL4O_00190 [bacterium]
MSGQIDITRRKNTYAVFVEFFVMFLVWYLFFGIAFYIVWPVLPIPKYPFILVDAILALIYIKLLYIYLNKKFASSKFEIYRYLRRLFLIYFIIFLIAYIGSAPNEPETYDFTMSLMANLVFVTLIIDIIYWCLYFKYKKLKKMMQRTTDNKQEEK